MFPNPVIDHVTARYVVSQPSAVQMDVIGADGKIIHARSQRHDKPGTYESVFSMVHQPPGVYVIRLKTGEKVHTSKIVVSR